MVSKERILYFLSLVLIHWSATSLIIYPQLFFFLLTRREHLSLPLIQGRRQEMALKESHIVGTLTSSSLHVGHVTFMYSLRICEPLSLSAKGG